VDFLVRDVLRLLPMQGDIDEPVKRVIHWRSGVPRLAGPEENAMSLASMESTAPTEIEASLYYTVRTAEKPVSESYGLRRQTGEFAKHVVAIRNGRPHRSQFGLDSSGFEFLDHPTKVRDFFDQDQVRVVYCPEMEELIAHHYGAVRVHLFDHTLRSGDENAQEVRKIREPVKSVHNDYTEWSGPQRVRDLLPEEAESLLQRRFAIIQVWRAINRPVERDPLAIVDSRTLDRRDFIETERRYPGRVGEIYRLEFNPAHRWYWFPHMERDEALLFKTYDSAKDGRARFGAHTSFDAPFAPDDACPRESIEVRAFAFF
jgi:hypothetical protein